MPSRTAAARQALTDRLASLEAERRALQAETLPGSVGDLADRATNVDGLVRLAVLDERIDAVHGQLSDLDLPAAAAPRATNGVTVGATVTVAFDDGDITETLLFDDVDHAGSAVDVISPASPLGKALLGAAVGDVVTYKAVRGRQLTARLTAVG